MCAAGLWGAIESAKTVSRRANQCEMGLQQAEAVAAVRFVTAPYPWKALYRLLSSEKVTVEHILESHRAATAERCAPEKVVLAIQDTTALNNDGLEGTVGLVDIGGPGKGVEGLMAHFGLAVSPFGRTLSVFTLDADFRHLTPDTEKESRHWLEGHRRADELAASCFATRVISVCVREADNILISCGRSAVTNRV